MTPASTLVAPESVAQRILLIRGHKVMIDADLADLYGVATKALKLNQAVRRNLERFPSDFMFQLTTEEKQEVVTNCNHLVEPKFSSSLPNVFTEYGALIPGNVAEFTGISSPYEVPDKLARIFHKNRSAELI